MEKAETQGLVVVLAGFSTVIIAFVLVLTKGGVSDSKDALSALTTVTGVIGTLAGAFFGINVGSAGKQKIEDQRNTAQERLIRAAAALPPETARAIGLGTHIDPD